MTVLIKKIFYPLVPFLLLFTAWSVITYLQLVPSYLLPSPLAVISVFFRLLKEGTLYLIVSKSLLNCLPPYLLSIIVAFLVGLFVGTSKVRQSMILPLISFFYPIPSLAWLPMIIIMTGFTQWSVWILVFISSFLKIVLNMITGIQNINPHWILAAKNLGMSKMGVLFKVVIPGALPNIVIGLRMGFGSSWRSLIGAEMLVTGVGGLGKYIWMSQWSFDLDQVLTGIITIAAIGLICELLIFKKLELVMFKNWEMKD
ncbi:MAG: ABC transporter permease [Candidatus Magasanikbacteria bacterium]